MFYFAPRRPSPIDTGKSVGCVRIMIFLVRENTLQQNEKIKKLFSQQQRSGERRKRVIWLSICTYLVFACFDPPPPSSSSAVSTIVLHAVYHATFDHLQTHTQPHQEQTMIYERTYEHPFVEFVPRFFFYLLLWHRDREARARELFIYTSLETNE